MSFPVVLCRAVSVLTLLPLVACGVRVKQDHESAPPVQQMREDTAFADQYYVDDLGCQSAAGSTTIGSMPISTWTGTSTNPVAYGFANTISNDSLANTAVNGTYYNLYQQSACGAAGDTSSCKNPVVINPPMTLRVCRATGPYARISVEEVALTSLANITVAYNYYQTIPNHEPSLASSRLLVLPTVEKTYENGTKRSVSTDNLAYATVDGEPAFVIYPKGARAAKAGLWNGLNLWELPWTLAHEFGHHVFRTHTGVSSIADAIDGEDVGGLSNVTPIHSFPLDEEEATGFALTDRSVSNNDVWSAVNEGYADMYAFYVYGSKAGLLANVDCLDTNRDVASASFSTGKAKALSADIIANFYSTTRNTAKSCKSGPDFQDIHAIGAIIAHGVDQIFDASLGVDQGNDAALQKVQLLLKWAERLGKTAGSGGTLTFDLLVKDALLTAAPDGKLKNAACDAARQAFPEYADTWFASGSSLTCN